MLSDPKRVMHKTMTESPAYEAEKGHKPAGIDVDTATALHIRM